MPCTKLLDCLKLVSACKIDWCAGACFNECKPRGLHSLKQADGELTVCSQCLASYYLHSLTQEFVSRIAWMRREAEKDNFVQLRVLRMHELHELFAMQMWQKHSNWRHTWREFLIQKSEVFALNDCAGKAIALLQKNLYHKQNNIPEHLALTGHRVEWHHHPLDPFPLLKVTAHILEHFGRSQNTLGLSWGTFPFLFRDSLPALHYKTRSRPVGALLQVWGRQAIKILSHLTSFRSPGCSYKINFLKSLAGCLECLASTCTA